MSEHDAVIDCLERASKHVLHSSEMRVALNESKRMTGWIVGEARQCLAESRALLADVERKIRTNAL
jgi:hypothetical protein